jgi:hypothetical protein
MMLGDLKNKFIVHEGDNFRPYVEWCGDAPVKLELCESLHKAQVLLKKYPPDCWDSYLSQVDERRERGDKWTL